MPTHRDPTLSDPTHRDPVRSIIREKGVQARPVSAVPPWLAAVLIVLAVAVFCVVILQTVTLVALAAR